MKWEHGVYSANGNCYLYCYLIVSFLLGLHICWMFPFPYTCLHIIFHTFSKFWFLGLHSLWVKMCIHRGLSLGVYFILGPSSQLAKSFKKNHHIWSLNYMNPQGRRVLWRMSPPCRKHVSRNVLKACSHLFVCSSPIPHGPSQCHPCLIFLHKHIFVLIVKWRGWTGRSLSAYVISNHLWTHKIGLNEPRHRKKVSKGNHFKPDQMKKKKQKTEPDAAKFQSLQGHFAMVQAWLSDTIPFTISDTKWFCLQSHLIQLNYHSDWASQHHQLITWLLLSDLSTLHFQFQPSV